MGANPWKQERNKLSGTTPKGSTNHDLCIVKIVDPFRVQTRIAPYPWVPFGHPRLLKLNPSGVLNADFYRFRAGANSKMKDHGPAEGTRGGLDPSVRNPGSLSVAGLTYSGSTGRGAWGAQQSQKD